VTPTSLTRPHRWRGWSGLCAVVLVVGCGDPGVNGNGDGNGNAGGSGGGFSLPEAGAGSGGNGGSGGGGQTPSQDANCGLKRIDLQKRPADLLLILDRSGSMIDEVGGKEKWAETVSALDTVVSRTQAAVAWGLKLFPLPSQCSVPSGITVPVATSNHAAIMKSINDNRAVENGGSTPTREAVNKGFATLKATPSPNSKYLLLATDGQPNCLPGGDNRDEDRAGSVAAVAAAASAGIPTFVVGIATAGSTAHETLNEMADKGGRPRSNATRYYPVVNRDELVAALEAITGQIASCTFPLNPPPPVPSNVAVEVDGMRVARDPSQGWDYGPGNGSIVLNGALCDRLKAGTAKNVQILYGCPGITIP
jgi:hypothetical protein